MGRRDGAAHGDAGAGHRKRRRLAVEKLLEVKDARSLVYGLVDVGLRDLAELQRERHVVVDRHMRVKRVGLEDHGDVSVGRLNVVHDPAIDLQRAGGDVFQAGNHAQRRGFAAADRDDKLLILDLG